MGRRASAPGQSIFGSSTSLPKTGYQILLDGFRSGTIPEDLDVNALLEDLGGTSLHVAAMANNVMVLEEILSRVDDINVRNRMGWTALAVAVGHNDRDSVDCLVKHGALLNTRDQNQSSPLYNAIFHNMTDMAMALIAAGADVNEVVWGNRTLLNVVSSNSPDDVANALIPALIAAGANIQDAMTDGFCQVGWCNFKVDRMRLFLAHGARLADMPEFGNEAIVADIAYLKFYLEHGGDPNKRDTAGMAMPLLSVALAKRSWEAVELLAPVADVNCVDYDASIARSCVPFAYADRSYLDAAPLRQAVKINLDTALLEKMLEHASVQPPEYYAEVLKTALEGKSTSNVALLASKVDLKSECFLFYAVRNPDFVAVLLELGADPNQRDPHGRPPLLCACSIGEEASARLLLPHTTNCNVGDHSPPLFETVAEAGLRGLARDIARTVSSTAPTPPLHKIYWQPRVERSIYAPHACDVWCYAPNEARAYAKVELEHMAALCTLLDEPFWWTKEALPTLPPGVFTGDTDIIHGELQLIRDEFVRPLGLVPNTTRGVYHADDALTVDLLSSLDHLLTPLEADAFWVGNVLEVVDPAMYGAVYGQSRFSLQPHHMHVGTSMDATVQHKMSPSAALADAVCPHLQMLPTPVTWDASSRQVTLESYVNNIHPSQSALYSVLAETLATVLPLLDAARWVPRKVTRRVFSDGGHENELRLLRIAYLEHHGLDPSTPVVQKTLRAFKKAQGPITSQLQPAPPTLENAQRFWNYGTRRDDDDSSWHLPSKPQSHQVLCHVQCLRVTSEAPTMTTAWRRGSGAVNESIQFTAVVLYGAHNVSLRVEFRETFEHADFGPLKRNPAIEVLLSDSVAQRVSQDTGFVTVRPGRLLLIRSSAAYRIHLQSTDSSRKGVAKLLFLGFVRPSAEGVAKVPPSSFARSSAEGDNAILSTADVPPQQRDWLFELFNATPIGLLPTGVQELVLTYVGHATLGKEEARVTATAAKAAREVVVAASLA